MFSALFPERLSSTWRLAILQGVLLIGSVALCVLMAGWALKGDLTSIAKAVVLDDLGEYSVIYNRDGLRRLTEVFAAGKHENNQAARVTTPHGEVVFEAVPATMGDYKWPARVPQDLPPGGTLLRTISNPTHTQQLLVGCQLLPDGNVLWFGRTDSEDRAYEEHIRRNLWLAGAASAGLMLLPLWWFARHVLRPVQRMMVTAGNLSEGRTDRPIVAPEAVPELRAFADAYNRGLHRIRALTDELRSANDQLAHELRTPLARIRGNLENYHDNTDNAAARDAAARGLEEIDRATHLVQTILTIRSGDHQALRLHLEKVDLRSLLTQLHELYQPAAEEAGLHLKLDASESFILEIDQQRINQALANLIDNAINYTPKGGTVLVALETSPRTARIVVRDTGRGLRKEEIDIIWDRHVRGSAAEAGVSGLGLGLSLVRAIAIAHGGSAGCMMRDGGGAEFWIELPVKQPDP